MQFHCLMSQIWHLTTFMLATDGYARFSRKRNTRNRNFFIIHAFLCFLCMSQEKKWSKGHCICLTSNKSPWRKYLCCSLLRWWSSVDWACHWIQVMKTLFETKANRKSQAQASSFSLSIVVNRSVNRFGAIYSRWLHNFSQAYQVRLKILNSYVEIKCASCEACIKFKDMKRFYFWAP